KAYEDGTHELEQVRVESYGAEGKRHDVITSDRGKVSDPGDLNKLDAEFISNVVVETTEDLVIKTSYLHYDHMKNTVDTNEPVEFAKKNVSGRSTGMLVEATDERVHLLKDVDVIIKPEDKTDGKSPVKGDGKGNKEDRETTEERAERKARKRERKREKKL